MTELALAALAFVGLSYLVAYLGSLFFHRKNPANQRPGLTVWGREFAKVGPNSGGPTMPRVTVQMRDGRQIHGLLSAYSSEDHENRELSLQSPIYLTFDRSDAPALIDADFVLLREADISMITGAIS